MLFENRSVGRSNGRERERAKEFEWKLFTSFVCKFRSHTSHASGLWNIPWLNAYDHVSSRVASWISFLPFCYIEHSSERYSACPKGDWVFGLRMFVSQICNEKRITKKKISYKYPKHAQSTGIYSFRSNWTHSWTDYSWRYSLGLCLILTCYHIKYNKKTAQKHCYLLIGKSKYLWIKKWMLLDIVIHSATDAMVGEVDEKKCA